MLGRVGVHQGGSHSCVSATCKKVLGLDGGVEKVSQEGVLHSCVPYIYPAKTMLGLCVDALIWRSKEVIGGAPNQKSGNT